MSTGPAGGRVDQIQDLDDAGEVYEEPTTNLLPREGNDDRRNDSGGPSLPRPISGPPGNRIPFLPNAKASKRRGSTFEPEYPADEIGAEMGPNARVWRVYLDEADEYDAEMIEGFRDTTDVLLVFAGLFSAVVSTFVSQTSLSLQPDYAQITASLMTELVSLQRAVAVGAPISSIPPSELSFTSETTRDFDQWVNGLWFTSLYLSLIAALIAVLAKQWLLHYMSALSGTPRQRVLVHHFRFMGLAKWRVASIIGLLPVLLHTSLFMFMSGLVVLLWTQNRTVATVLLGLTTASYLFYLCSTILAAILPDCSYKTPLSGLLRYAWQLVGVVFRRLSNNSQHLATRLWARYPMATPKGNDQAAKTFQSVKELELQTSETMIDELVFSSLLWLSSSSSNPNHTKIVGLSFAGTPFGFKIPSVPDRIPLAVQSGLAREGLALSERETLLLSLTHIRPDTIYYIPPSLADISPILQGAYAATGGPSTFLHNFLVNQTRLPPSLWVRLLQRDIHDPILQISILLLKILEPGWRVVETLSETTTNWELPPYSTLQELCQREPRMRLHILSFLCLSFGLNSPARRPGINLTVHFQPLVQVVQAILRLIESETCSNPNKTLHLITSVERTLLVLPTDYWCLPNFVSALHRCGVLQNRIIQEHSLPITTPIYHHPSVPESLGIVMLYFIHLLPHPGGMYLRRLLVDLFRSCDADVYAAFLEHDGLGLLRQSFPIDFSLVGSPNILLQLGQAINTYLDILMQPAAMQKGIRKEEHFEYITRDDNLAWIIWLACRQLNDDDGDDDAEDGVPPPKLTDAVSRMLRAWTITNPSSNQTPHYLHHAVDSLLEQFRLEALSSWPLAVLPAEDITQTLHLLEYNEPRRLYCYNSPALDSLPPRFFRTEAYTGFKRVLVEGEKEGDAVYGPYAIYYDLAKTPPIQSSPLSVTGWVRHMNNRISRIWVRKTWDIELGKDRG